MKDKERIIGGSLALVGLLGIVLVIVAANFEKPPDWFLFPGWLLIGVSIGIHIARTPNASPFKGALCLPVLAFLFSGFGFIWPPAHNLIFKPSEKHFLEFFFGAPFLAFTTLYFMALSTFIRMQADRIEQKLLSAALVSIPENQKLNFNNAWREIRNSTINTEPESSGRGSEW